MMMLMMPVVRTHGGFMCVSVYQWKTAAQAARAHVRQLRDERLLNNAILCPAQI